METKLLTREKQEHFNDGRRASPSGRHYNQKHICRDFPGRPVVKTLPSNAGGMGSIPGWGVKIPHA